MISNLKCDEELKKIPNSESVNEPEYCIECYNELHYYVPETKGYAESK